MYYLSFIKYYLNPIHIKYYFHLYYLNSIQYYSHR